MKELLHRLISGYHVAVRLLRHEVIDATPAQWRLAADTLARLYIPPKDLRIESHDWCGLRTDIISRGNTDPECSPIVWLHGGGFAFCSPRTHRAAASTLSFLTGRPVYLPDYPLAPEHPYPQALDALSQVPVDGPIDIVGDSAGGNLAMAWALRRKAGDRLALLSPWVDLRVDGASAIQDGVDHSAFDREDLREYAGLYLSGASATHPDCSPVLANEDDLGTLGRVYLESARNELLHANATLLTDQLALANVQLHRHEEPRAHHGWQLLPDILPEAKHSLERVAQFITMPSPE